MSGGLFLCLRTPCFVTILFQVSDTCFKNGNVCVHETNQFKACCHHHIAVIVLSFQYVCAPSTPSSLLRAGYAAKPRQAPVVRFPYRRTSYLKIVFVITVTVITFAWCIIIWWLPYCLGVCRCLCLNRWNRTKKRPAAVSRCLLSVLFVQNEVR